MGEEWTFLSSSLTSPSSFFMLLHQPVLLYKKERPIARRQSRVCCVCARARLCMCLALTATLNVLTRQGAFSATDALLCDALATFRNG